MRSKKTSECNFRCLQIQRLYTTFNLEKIYIRQKFGFKFDIDMTKNIEIKFFLRNVGIRKFLI